MTTGLLGPASAWSVMTSYDPTESTQIELFSDPSTAMLRSQGIPEAVDS